MKPMATAALLLSVLALASAAGGSTSRSSAAAPNGSVQALVVLSDQASLPSAQSTRRGQRLSEVVRALRDAAATSQRPLLQLLGRRRGEGRVEAVTPLWIVNGILITAKPEVIRELAARPDVLEVRVVRTLRAADSLAAAPAEPNVSLVNAPSLWSLADRGEGVVVASLDTGVDVTHPDLASSWRGGTDSWFDPYGQHPTAPVDVNGHGTWTMGAMVGGDAGGTSIGVAPGAKWIAAKIFNDQGVATTAAIHQAFQWLLDPDGNPATNDAPDVVNGSWTMGATGCDLEFQLDLRALRAAGILPVFAAGNGGPNASTSYSPANNPEALAVGADDYAGSSRGPGACDGRAFPDVVAPGANVRTADLYGGYASETGTSMSAPEVSGALALLLSAFPDLSADRQQAAIESGAADLGAPGPDNDTGYGRLDALGAYTWLTTAPDFTVSASPASVTTTAGAASSFAVSVNGLNGFASDVALSVSGLAPGQGTTTLTPATVVGGTGTATLDVTTDATLPAGSYDLTVTGTSGSTTRTSHATLKVSPPPDFAVAATPSSASTLPGSAVSYTVATSAFNGFAGGVSLSVAGLSPSQATWSFAPATITGAGTSTLTVTTSAAIAPATYPLTITGTSGGTSHTAAVTLVVVAPPDFTMAATPSSISAVAGSTFNYTIAIGAKNGFTGGVALSLTGLTTSQASWTFTPASVATSGTSKLAVTTTASLAVGTYKLTIKGVNGSLVHTVAVNLLVATPPDFTLAASPASASVAAGAAASYTVSLASKGGFSGPVTLTVSGQPSNATVTFTPSSVASPGSSTMKVQTTASTPRGTFTLRVTGTSGALSHQATVTLTVR